MLKCDFSKIANQFYWNHTSTWVFSCNFAYLQNSCFDEHLRGTTSSNFYSACLPYFSVQIRVKFGFFSIIFLSSSMFSSERTILRLPKFYLFLFRLISYELHSVTFCWIVFLHGGAWLNRFRNPLELPCSFFFRKNFLQQKLVLLLIFGAFDPWISCRKAFSNIFYRPFVTWTI